jgi:hypothetical protein
MATVSLAVSFSLVKSVKLVRIPVPPAESIRQAAYVVMLRSRSFSAASIWHGATLQRAG